MILRLLNKKPELELVPYWDAVIAREVEFHENGKVKRIVYVPFDEWPKEAQEEYTKSVDQQ